jgi:hypothetical protein
MKGTQSLLRGGRASNAFAPSSTSDAPGAQSGPESAI